MIITVLVVLETLVVEAGVCVRRLIRYVICSKHRL
jgi:hypothetical protein